MKVTFEDKGRIHRIPDTSKLKDQWEDESKTHQVPNTSKPQGSAYISIKMSKNLTKQTKFNGCYFSM